MSDFRQFLTTQKLADLEANLPRQYQEPILAVRSNDTVQEVLSTLLKHNILAAPVLDPKQNESSETPFLGTISVVDLLIAFAFRPVFNTYDTDVKLSDLTDEKLKEVLESEKPILRAPVGDLLGLSLEGKRLWAYSEKHPLNKLFDVFSVGVHRVLVSHKIYPTWSFVTQMDVIRYLKGQSYDSDTSLHKIWTQSISSLKLGTDSKDLFTFSSKHSAIRAFRYMLQRNELSALPIVDTDGKLIETLSASDFRSVSLENMKDTLLPVCDFLRKARGDVKQVVGTADEPLYSLVDKILFHGYHRIWIVDNEQRPIGVVSLTDIIKVFSVYAPLSNDNQK